MILRGIIDVGVARIATNNSTLLVNCGGAPSTQLSDIESGPVILRRRSRSAEVQLTQEEGGECIEHSISVGRNVARQLLLRNERRYRVEFDTDTSVMSFFPKPVSRARLPLKIGTPFIEDEDNPIPNVVTLRNNQVLITAGAQVTLGIIGERLLMKHGLKQKHLQIIGSNIFLDPFVQLTPRTAEQLGLSEGNAFMEFNQIKSILRINPGK